MSNARRKFLRGAWKRDSEFGSWWTWCRARGVILGMGRLQASVARKARRGQGPA